MRILVAPLEFKGTLTAHQAAAAIQRGIVRSGRGFEVKTLPLADGGPGSVEAVLAYYGGERMLCEVEDPLGRKVSATWARVPTRDGGRLGVVEMAAASGLWRLSREERAPLRADTFGTGQLILEALRAGVSEVLVCAGGSATNDGGSGALRALGAALIGSEARGAEALLEATRVDLSALAPRLSEVKLTVATDVIAPLLGPGGASRVFGPQKGASAADVDRLEHAMARWSGLIKEATGNDLSATPGAGAAGGLAFGLLALGASLRPGLEVLSELLGLDRHLHECDVAITGEGQLDRQTLLGKGPWRIRQRAQAHGRPTLLFVGRVAPDVDTAGLGEVIAVSPEELTDAELRPRAAELLEDAAADWARRA